MTWTGVTFLAAQQHCINRNRKLSQIFEFSDPFKIEICIFLVSHHDNVALSSCEGFRSFKVDALVRVSPGYIGGTRFRHFMTQRVHRQEILEPRH